MRYLPALLAAAAAAVPAYAQCSPSASNFCVTIDIPTPGSPIPEPHEVVFYINGQESPVLTLNRGSVYTFTMVNVSESHPFYLSTSQQGGGSGLYSNGVSPTLVWGNQVMTFTVPQAAPSTLWYACDNHDNMGWRIDIVNPTACYANCDASTTEPVLNVADFSCFLQEFAAGSSYANCDGSTTEPVLNVADFSCFLQEFAGGCP